jgi:hypothetical protein
MLNMDRSCNLSGEEEQEPSLKNSAVIIAMPHLNISIVMMERRSPKYAAKSVITSQ